MKNNFHIYVMFPDPEFENFDNLKKIGNVHIVFNYYKIKIPIFRKLFKFIFNALLNSIIAKNIYNMLAKKYPDNFISGWNSITSFNTQMSEIERIKMLEYYRPNIDVIKRCRILFSKIVKDADIILGVHIRRGDYKYYLDGRYYYSVEEYIDYMRRLIFLFPQKRVSFFISTNEKNIEIPSDVNFFINNNATVVDDLYCLSLCDYIVGPPSSFSRFSSYIGQVPIHQIKNMNEEISIGDFFINNNYLND
ncbi:alpha-1,2-fucosyltransferase [Xylanibacter oryzae]|uniref:alpha-1,2-fucosyltransferase n=1 Tax=Xylanibacter oryzae TaxID=185293 RepID=UPI0004AE3C43|nr:alpha-1,2-fucosyltransferase [Xylanibacter oryzae]